jgi:hypothetical protein
MRQKKKKKKRLDERRDGGNERNRRSVVRTSSGCDALRASQSSITTRRRSLVVATLAKSYRYRSHTQGEIGARRLNVLNKASRKICTYRRQRVNIARRLPTQGKVQNISIKNIKTREN